eukprot:1683367-Heterocapsa_arctica.AAC.1
MWVLPEHPDISFMVRDLARRVQGPTEYDAGRLKRLLRDVRGTTNMDSACASTTPTRRRC